MRLIKDITDNSMKPSALDVLNRLKSGDRVFGNPGQGLKLTTKKLEDKRDEMEKEKGALDILDNTGEIRDKISAMKAGIAGEEGLAEFIEAMIKSDKELQDCVTFASLSDPEQNSGGDNYISDSDFIMTYGKDILIVDVKNINTTPDMPIYLQDGVLVSAGGKEILEINPSVGVWRKIFSKYGIEPNSIHGCTVIFNKKGALIWRNPEWYNSETKPLHISQFVDFLHDWIKDKDSATSLKMLTIISNMQIREDTAGMDFTYAKRTFGI